MSSPNVISTIPLPNTTDIVLGTNIVVTFDSVIDTSTINPVTFSLTGPAQTQILTPAQLISSDPNYINGRDFITGSFAFSTNTLGNTVVTFTPSRPLQPNVTYTVLLIGKGALLVNQFVSDINGNPLSSNYQWTFSTGALNTTTPPLQAPLPYQYASIDPSKIKISVNNRIVEDLLDQDLEAGFEITLTFPAPIDQTSFDPLDILMSIEQFLGDPTIPMPTGLTPTVDIEGNTITITLQST